MAAVFVDQQYNQINTYYLDKRRPETYIIGEPNLTKALTERRTLVDVGQDLQGLIENPQFKKDIQQVRFYKQDFDEPFQVLHQAVTYGYKPTGGVSKGPTAFMVIRFPKQLAAALRFRRVAE